MTIRYNDTIPIFVVTCDACGQVIELEKDMNRLWIYTGNPKTGEETTYDFCSWDCLREFVEHYGESG